MTHPHHNSDNELSTEIPDDPRILTVAREYLERLEAGETPHVQDYLNRHPDLADALEACLAGLDLVHRSVRQDQSRPATTSSQPPLLPESLGDFRIIRELGRGGMGVVYEAIQTSLGRRVALKVLPFTATLQPRQLQRFLTEAQAAAHLHHPNIVPVFAVGSDRGVHYYAMQLIEGMSLAELLTRLRRDAGWTEPGHPHSSSRSSSSNVHSKLPGPNLSSATLEVLSSRLSTEQSQGRNDYYQSIARFARQAAEALAYAHELGIVHRDVKPANMMLDARGQVWVTDFGLAQVQSGAELTQTGDLLGTLRYMSPEQVQGDRGLLDQRTDIYSLGATLYELATLHPLFSGVNRQTLLTHVLHEDPAPPRSLNKSIPVELETIIVKAINKSAADRYATAQHLADDLQRFLTNQPILAQRPTVADHVRKWARRHPVTVSATVILLALVSIGLTIHNRLIAREQLRTEAALQREQARAVESEQSFNQARQAVDLLIQIGEEELADKPPLQGTRKRLLVAALAYYKDFIAHRSTDAASQQELAAVETRVTSILRELVVVESFFQAQLTADPDVQADLQVTPEQRQQLEELNRQPLPDPDATHSSSAARQRGFVQHAESQTARLALILTDQQRERLKQISLQSQGLFAFSEPEVIDALQLTTEQRKQIREIEFQSFFSRGPRHGDGPRPGEGGRHPDGPRKGGPPPGGFREGGFRGPPPHHEPDEQRMKQAVDQVTALLKPTQRQRWEQLIGLPFKGPIGMKRFGFPHGGPPFGPPPQNPNRQRPPQES